MKKIWLCRAGKGSCYFERITLEKRIVLPWEGYDYDLKKNNSMERLKELVCEEKQTTNSTSIATWASMINIFVNDMEIGDLVLIPFDSSHSFRVCVIQSDYCFDARSELHHFRTVECILDNLPADKLLQSTRYSLGAYRSVFRVKQIEEILSILKNEGCDFAWQN